MLHAQMDGHHVNVVGALAVALGDRVREATEAAAGMPGALPAALVSLHEWAGGRTVDTLAGGLRLSHSRTVRVIDRLEAEGLAVRERDPADGRSVLVRLTPAGERVGAAVLAAREAALRDALAGLAPETLAAFAGGAEHVLARLTDGRRAARANCRLCASHDCGHHDGRCPVTRAADAADAADAARAAA
jgi:DNA-binding MarR family transcriptional regulator